LRRGAKTNYADPAPLHSSDDTLARSAGYWCADRDDVIRTRSHGMALTVASTAAQTESTDL
jgi:hypothetical protein